MAEVAAKQNTTVAPAVKEGVARGLAGPVDKLSKFGGFSFLESSVEGIQNLNPERKARKNIFLKDEGKEAERAALKADLDLWIELLSGSATVAEMVDKCKTKSAAVSAHLAESQMKAVSAVKELERSYRNVMLFSTRTPSRRRSRMSLDRIFVRHSAFHHRI